MSDPIARALAGEISWQAADYLYHGREIPCGDGSTKQVAEHPQPVAAVPPTRKRAKPTRATKKIKPVRRCRVYLLTEVGDLPSHAKEHPMSVLELSGKSLSDLALTIRQDWKKPYFGAVPYIEAMVDSNPDGSYGLDDAKTLILYFLSNAKAWRGEVAKAIKAEMKKRIA